MEKKSNGRCAKMILISLKKVDAQKEIFFLFYQIVTETLFLWKNLSGKS